jgi:hypothetical protein
MSFTASNIIIGDSKNIKESPNYNIETPLPQSPSSLTSLELNDKELELLLLTIKNGLFRGEYVEIVYNLTLKLQKYLIDTKYKNNKL